MIEQRLKGKIVVDIVFLSFQAHLAGIQDVIRIKCLLYGPHNLQCRTQLFFHIGCPSKTGPVLSRNGAPHLKGEFCKLVRGRP